MASIAFVAPLLPGGRERMEHLAREVSGPRRPEMQEFYRRMKVTSENWYVQSTPQGDIVIVSLEANDFAAAFDALAGSREPFDVWFKEQAKAIHGIDFNEPPRAPLPTQVYGARSA